MAKISQSQVDNIAELAKLPLSNEQKSQYAKELSKILEFVEQINRAKSHQIKLSETITGIDSVFRNDKIDKTRCLSQKEALANAPSKQDGYFKVKAILES